MYSKIKVIAMDLDGTLDHLKQLLTGPWTEDCFVIAEPNSLVTAEMCTLKG